MRFVIVSAEDAPFSVDGARAADIDPTDRIGEPMARQGGKIMAPSPEESPGAFTGFGAARL
jgi:hypothetical protein